MQVLRGSASQRLHVLVSIGIVLGAMLIALVGIVLGQELLSIVGRFRTQVLMFVIGAILAYLMAPVVRVFQVVVRARWLAVLCSYLLLIVALLVLGVLLVNPFISEARALVNNLHNPAASSLQSLRDVQTRTASVYSDIQKQAVLLSGNVPVTTQDTAGTERTIEAVQTQLTRLRAGEDLRGRIRIPPSYLAPIAAALDRLSADYVKATTGSANVDPSQLNVAYHDVQGAVDAEHASYARAVSTPVLLLNLQVWLDQRGIAVDLHDRFGNALQQVSNQLAGLLNNALGMALAAGTLTLNALLIVIISIYFLSAGRRLVSWLVHLAPEESRWRAEYFFLSLDRILGAYLRVQIIMAFLAAALDAAGALVFGVPYAVVIFLSAFLLSLVPVIGPVILPIAPAFIALVFAPFPKSVIFIAWVVLVEQVVTNVVGPRVQGQSLGIHPLEAMAAALVGFPIAGFLGSFFAVPAVAFLHVVIRSVVHARSAETERPPTVAPPAGSGVRLPPGAT